ncbi:flagellar export protein FliJ [Clostridium sp. BJN0001]|uniref:flagellar export protein FliJ n=1 Tax=Clostridium sp. BJN0001 TaxID=2930219 RepID=UPI001FD3D555|nr:flagellar export protein FliJ [Clostridium sp. BJN0001]
MAKKFKFSLDKLLEIRRDKEEESKRVFTKAQAEKDLIEKKLKNLHDNYEKYKVIDANEDVTYQKLKRYYLTGIQSSIKETKKDLVKKEEEVEKNRKKVIEKQIDRKTVETLKNKKYDKFIKEENKAEQIVTDELGLYAFIRNRKDR